MCCFEPVADNDADGPALAMILANCDPLRLPLLISVPHAGRCYPPAIYENLKVSPHHLLRLEDRYVDRLAADAIIAGFPTIIAEKPRAWVDLNRSPTELDPAIIDILDKSRLTSPSRKVRGGLGLIPRSLGGAGELWQDKWPYQQIVERIADDHEPYHQAVGNVLRHMRTKFGRAILLDLHSMPPIGHENDVRIDFVIGDRFGRSCGAYFSELAHACLSGQGYQVQVNHPYSGGYILDRHGDRQADIHALQIEVDRRLYLDQDLREPTPAAAILSKVINALAAMLSDEIFDGRLAEAAE